MKRLVIIAEGETEESFINNILTPHFYSVGLNNIVQCFKIKKSNGGITKYSDVKRDIINTLYETDVIVSTMLDFYRLPSSFPGMGNASALPTHLLQVKHIEDCIKKDIESAQNRTFGNLIPYIQLHEFEALIFSSINGVDALFDSSEYKRKDMLQVINEFPNPEDINNMPNTAPSVRLKGLIPGYDKVIYGIDILQNHGMSVLLTHCPHFRDWVNKLEDALRG